MEVIPETETKPKKKRISAGSKPPKTPTVTTAAEPDEQPKKRDDRPPVWKINPDGTKTRCESIPNFQGTHPALLRRGDELIKFGYTPEQAIEQIKKEVQEGLIDVAPPAPGESQAYSEPVSATQPDPDAEAKLQNYLKHHYDYLQAYVRLECGQINGLPLSELEDVASLCVRPAKSFEQWAATRHGIDYSMKEQNRGEEEI